jgi:hypothetical protein
MIDDGGYLAHINFSYWTKITNTPKNKIKYSKKRKKMNK